MWWNSGRRSVFLMLALVSAGAADDVVDVTRPGAERQAELLHLLKQDCGSCHGMTLKGGLGPALTQQALAGKPVEYLYLTVRDGHPGTPMPPWQGILADEEIRWLVEQMRTGVATP